MTVRTAEETEALLTHGEVRVLGQVQDSSNVVVVVEVDGVRAVHKPIAGETPLWDFPEGTLALRERATWLVARALGWDVVPPTVLRDGPWGPGSFQLWVHDDGTRPYVDAVPAGRTPPGWAAVLQGEDGDGNRVEVVHRDHPELRRLALLDVVVNNSDRKGGHVLTRPDGGPVGIDHGLTFHTDPKLRTVLWGWVDEALTAEESLALTSLAAALDDVSDAALGGELGRLLSDDEIGATRTRLADLLDAQQFPGPDGRWPAVPWPPF